MNDPDVSPAAPEKVSSRLSRMSRFRNNLKRYYRYVFSKDAFAARTERGEIRPQALETARSIRGADRPPAIIIHGIMKRSGTVYTGELLGLHPEIHPHPNQMWETPFLAQTGEIRRLQENYTFTYRQNRGKLGENDFLPLFGSAFTAYMYSFVPENKRMLLKVPGVEYLDYFFDVFPGEQLLLLTRDGRDLVTSTIKTWPQLRFSDVCRRWSQSAQMILRFDRAHAGRPGYRLARFEEAVKRPEAFVRSACEAFDLDPGSFPFDRIASLPVIGSSTTRKEGKSWMKRTSNFNPIGRWQTWTSRQKRTFKRIAGQSLVDLGYCDDLDW